MDEPAFRIVIQGRVRVRVRVRRRAMGCRPTFATIWRGGPTAVRSDNDASEMAPFVVGAAERAEAEGFAAVVVDCTDDAGVAAARHGLSIPVVGDGEALRAAIARAAGVVIEWSGDELRSTELAALLADVPRTDDRSGRHRLVAPRRRARARRTRGDRPAARSGRAVPP